MTRLYGKYDPSDVYALNENNAYYDGFYGQKAILIDEHLVAKDVADRKEIASGMIHMVNTMPCPLISAALEDKGKHWIDADLFVTTNNDSPYPSNLGLTDYKAYMRRRSLVLKLVDREGDDYQFDCYPVLPPSTDVGNAKPVRLTGDQVAQMVYKKVLDNRSDFAKMADKSCKFANPGVVPPEFFSLKHTELVANDEGLHFSDPIEEEEIPQVNIDGSVEEQADDGYFSAEDTPDHHGGDDIPTSTADVGAELKTSTFKIGDLSFQDELTRKKIQRDWMSLLARSKKDEFNYNWFLRDDHELVNATANLPHGHMIIPQRNRTGFWEKWSYVSNYTMDSSAPNYSDLEPHEAFERYAAFTRVTVTPYNEFFWNRFCKSQCVLPFELTDLIAVCEGKLRYYDLIAICKTSVAPADSIFPTISSNGQAFLFKWFQRSPALYGFFTADMHLHLVKHYPRGYPASLKKVADLNQALKDSACMFSAQFGFTQTIVNYLKDPIYVVGGVLALAALTALAVGLIRWVFGSGLVVNKDIDLQSDDKHMKNVLKKTLRGNRHQKRKQRQITIEKQLDDNDTPQLQSLNMGMTDKVANNVEHVVVHYDDDSTASQFVTFMFGSQFVTSRHLFFRQGKKPVKIVFSFAMTMPVEMPISELLIYDDRQRDLVFVTVKSFPVNFAKLNKQGYLNRKSSPPKEGTKGLTRIQFTSDGSLHLMQGGQLLLFNGDTGRGDDKTTLISCYKVFVGGQKGMCGLPYIFDNTNVGFFAGIHVAGTDTMSVIAPIYEEDMELFPKDVVLHQAQYEPVAMADYVLPDLELLREIKPNAKEFTVTEKAMPCPAGMRSVAVSSHYFVGPSKTGLRESIVALAPDCPFEKTYGPAALKPFVNAEGQTVSPLNNSFAKFADKKILHLPDEFAHPDVAKGVFTADKPWGRLRKLTIEEAINGVPEWGNLHGIDMKTSAGVGYVNQGITRRELFDELWSDRYKRKIYKPKAVLMDQIDRMIAFVEMGLVPRCLALGLLKDEKRPIARVIAGASRLFFAADLVHLIVSRVYLGALISASETNVSQSDVAVGINPLGPEWELLFKRVSHMGEFKMTSTDIEGWDINFLLREVPIFCRLFRDHFPHLDSSYVRGIHCMLASSVNPFVFIGNIVFWMWIMCSGTLATSWFNTVANSMTHRGLFKVMLKDYISGEAFDRLSVEDAEWVSNVKFDDVVKATFFGDDNTQGVHRLLEDVYNGVSLAKYRKALLNWNTTDALKRKDIAKFDEVKDTMYLKRYVRDDGEYIKGALDKKAIESLIMWYNKGENPDVAQQAINFHVALREAYYWGPDYFEDLRKLLQPYFLQLNEMSGQDHTPTFTYKDLDESFRSQH
jgi:hypothetical protein